MIKKFSIKKINNNVYQIEEPWFKEHANLYLFKGSKFNLLIDCGLGLFNIKEFLNKEGFKNIKVSLTHSHFDHAGGIKYFSPKEILITPKIYRNLKDKRMWGLEYLKQEDFDKEMLSEANLFNIRKIYKNYDATPIGPKPRLFTKIDVGSFCFELINMPGHTNDSVAYYDRKKGILITGDALYIGKVYFNLLNSNKQKFKASLKNIAHLDFNLVLPGHNRIFNKAKALKIVDIWSRDL